MPPPSGVTIRPCRLDECEAVVQLWRRAGSIPTVTDNAESVRRLVAGSPGTLLVAELDGAIVGTIVAGWDGWRGAIYRVAVVPEQRRNGLGSALVEAALEWMRERGAQRCTAVGHTGEPHAMGFWRAMNSAGFAQQPEITRFAVNFDATD